MKAAPSGDWVHARRLSHIERVFSDMTYRILTAAAVLVALAAPALAGETKIERSGFCYRGNCSSETKITREEASKPNVGYLPNFSGTASSGSAPRSETTYFPARTEPAAPVDPKCMKLNACLKISPEQTIY